MQKVDKSKLTIIILAVVFALSLSVTITLAAFSANKTGDVTLTFADGLTMTIAPQNQRSIKVTSAGVDDYTFNYTPQTNVKSNLTYDGVNATLNKDGWVSYQVTIYETTSGSNVAPAGAWVKESGALRFYPPTNDPKPNWCCPINISFTVFDYSISNNTITLTSKAIWTDTGLTKQLWGDWAMRNRDQSVTAYVDDLGGRSFEVFFTVKARTDAAPTF